MSYYCDGQPHTRIYGADGTDGRIGAVITLCSQCDKPESQCICEKYCCFCQSQQDVRLCADGLYYCPDCREACDVRLADNEFA
jgi:hypothetical protein